VHADCESGPAPTEKEPNDAIALATALTQSGALTFGYISSSSDYDNFRVTVAPGWTLYAPLTRNYNLSLYNSAGSYPKGSLNGTGMTGYLSHYNGTATNQTYTIGVAGVSGSSATTQSYGLTASW
jgi:hypothetical protein